MTDAEFIEAVRKFAPAVGCYSFNKEERQRIGRYVRGELLIYLHHHRFAPRIVCSLATTFNLMDEMEQGMAAAVAAKLTQ